MYKIMIADYESKDIEVIVSAEVFEIFEDSRKQDLRGIRPQERPKG